MQNRRAFLAAGLSIAAHGGSNTLVAQDDLGTESQPAFEAERQAAGVEVLLPRNRVPLSFVIDDSTCLVNMGHFCTPQFAEALPHRAEYKKPWRDWPREIPDQFCFVGSVSGVHIMVCEENTALCPTRPAWGGLIVRCRGGRAVNCRTA